MAFNLDGWLLFLLAALLAPNVNPVSLLDNHIVGSFIKDIQMRKNLLRPQPSQWPP